MIRKWKTLCAYYDEHTKIEIKELEVEPFEWEYKVDVDDSSPLRTVDRAYAFAKFRIYVNQAMVNNDLAWLED